MNISTKKIEDLHQPVLLSEVIEFLKPRDEGLMVDATLGLGGHSEALLSITEQSRVIGIDQDLEAINFAKRRLSTFETRISFEHANFSEIKTVLKNLEIDAVDAIIADLGVSSWQLDSDDRGFSFRFDAPLDMRMNPDSEIETAAELLERLSEEEIANVIYQYGEERFSRRIARRIVERRNEGNPVKTTSQLADIVIKSVKRSKKDRTHPATRTFQALRIAVNKELEILERFLRDCVDLLKKDGRLVVISFHSLEDRIVKRTFQNLSGKCFCSPRMPVCVCGTTKDVEILTRKPIVPPQKEQIENPRSRSAKLRACLKLN